MTAPSVAKLCFALRFGLLKAWLAQRQNYAQLNFVANSFCMPVRPTWIR
jgi:hypothetical protein